MQMGLFPCWAFVCKCFELLWGNSLSFFSQCASRRVTGQKYRIVCSTCAVVVRIEMCALLKNSTDACTRGQISFVLVKKGQHNDVAGKSNRECFRVLEWPSVERGPSAQLAHANQHTSSTLVAPICIWPVSLKASPSHVPSLNVS